MTDSERAAAVQAIFAGTAQLILDGLRGDPSGPGLWVYNGTPVSEADAAWLVTILQCWEQEQGRKP